MFLEVGLVSVQHTVEPRQQLLGTVVRVHDDGDTVSKSNSSDKVGGGDGTNDGSFLLLSAVLDALTGPVGGTTLGDLQDDGGVQVSGSLHGGVGGGGRGDVEGGDGIVVLSGMFEELSGLFTRQNTGLRGQRTEEWVSLWRSVPMLELFSAAALTLTGTMSRAPILIDC